MKLSQLCVALPELYNAARVFAMHVRCENPKIFAPREIPRAARGVWNSPLFMVKCVDFT